MLKKSLCLIGLLTISLSATATDNSASGTITKFAVAPAGVLIQVSGGAPENCGQDYSKALLVDKSDQAMYHVALEAFKSDLDVTVKTLDIDERQRFCTIKKLILR